MSYGNIKAETDWEKSRLGKFTASKIGALFSANERKGKPLDKELSVGAKTYIRERASELLTGYTRQVSVYATEWGDAQEPFAVERLSEKYGEIVHYGNNNRQFFQYGGFSAGGSPDAETNNIEFEIKSPENFENHIEYSLLKKPAQLDKDYYFQLQFNMLILSKRNKIKFSNTHGVFVSWCPLIMRKEKQLFQLDVPPDLHFAEIVDDKLIMAQEYLIETLEAFSS